MLENFLAGSDMSDTLLPIIQRVSLIALGIGMFTVSAFHNGNAQPMQSPGGESVSFQRRDSVLERFRNYSGKKSRAALAALFSGTDPSFTQDPPILLADGTASARITLRIFSRAGELPRFSITGGRSTDARLTQNGLWIIVIVPNRGSTATSVTVLSGGNMIEYPLTVAPLLNSFDPKKADAVLIDYVTIANELAAAQRRPAPR